MRIEACTNRRAADRQIKESRHDYLQPFDITLYKCPPAAKLLSDGDGRRVLQMRTADLNDILVFVGLCPDGSGDVLDLGYQCCRALRSRDVHCRRKGIVRGLRPVDVV